MAKREVIVVGGGPSGLAAAIEAGKRGADVLLIDQNSRPGGQLFKQIHKFFGSSEHRAGVRGLDIGKTLLQEASEYGVEIWLNATVTGLFKEKKVSIERKLEDGTKKLEVLEAENIVLATGASENAVNFKGWTLPGVMSAGAAQTMVNVYQVLPGRKVLMIGSGNVGLIVSYQLMQAGADVVALVEAAPGVGGYGVHAGKISRAGVPIYTSHTVIEARGNERVEEAVICQVDSNWQPIPGSEKVFEVDTIAIAAGLKALTRLATMYGCELKYVPELGGWLPAHDENMQSSCEGVYVTGDVAGVEEASTALEEGKLAGVAIAEKLGYISPEEGATLKAEIRERLNGLRMGPFGVNRATGKEKLTMKA